MLCPPEKRLAALISVVEDGLSIREAMCVHGVAKGSVEKWVREHRDGRKTIESLRTAGITPTAPIGSPGMAHGPHRNERLPLDPLAQQQVLLQQHAASLEMLRRQRQRLEDERKVVAERLKAIDDALALLNDSFDSLSPSLPPP